MGYSFDPELAPIVEVLPLLDISDLAAARAQMLATRSQMPAFEPPATLDRAALHFCMGGPFHPGCEMTWPMRHGSMYRAPFRLRQRPDGHWVFELEADATIPAEYVLLRHYLGEPVDAVLEQKIAVYLRRIQGAHGGWPLFADGDVDVSATVKANAAIFASMRWRKSSGVGARPDIYRTWISGG